MKNILFVALILIQTAFAGKTSQNYDLRADLKKEYLNLVSISDQIRVLEIKLDKLRDDHGDLSAVQLKIEELQSKLNMASAELWHSKYDSQDMRDLQSRIREDLRLIESEDSEMTNVLSDLRISPLALRIGKEPKVKILDSLRRVNGLCDQAVAIIERREQYTTDLGSPMLVKSDRHQRPRYKE